jgi:hypothetical protein
MVLYESWHAGEYLIAAIKIQHVPFEVRHNIA